MSSDMEIVEMGQKLELHRWEWNGMGKHSNAKLYQVFHH